MKTKLLFQSALIASLGAVLAIAVNAGTQLEWRKITSFPSKTAEVVPLISHGRIYMFGGDIGINNFVSNSYSAEIKSDGTIGDWRSENSSPRAGPNVGVVEYHGWIYLQQNDNVIYRSRFHENGRVGDWQKLEGPGHGGGLATQVFNDVLYVIGGDDPIRFDYAQVHSARINVDGTLKPWVEGPRLPDRKYTASIQFANGRVYAIGGYGGDPSSVYSAALLSGGLIGPWRSEIRFPTPMRNPGQATLSGRLVVFGGDTSDQIFAATCDPIDGRITNWELIGNIPSSFRNMPSVVYDYDRENVYLIGGRDAVFNSPTSDAWVANLSLNRTVPRSQIKLVRFPVDQYAASGDDIVFLVEAIGNGPFRYQWNKNDTAIDGATRARLLLPNVSPRDSAVYSVTVKDNEFQKTSERAYLSVLSEGGSGGDPIRVTFKDKKPKPANKDSLVLITHGWEPLQPNAELGWMKTMAKAIQGNVSDNWEVREFTWLEDARYLNPEIVLGYAIVNGRDYGRKLNGDKWKAIHLIGHSAGAGLIEAIAREISSGTTVQCTFLDPYLGVLRENRASYGSSANWADCYFTQDFTGYTTAGGLSHAFNVDVSWLMPEHETIQYGDNLIAFTYSIVGHGAPYDFYTQSVTNRDEHWCGAEYGFSASLEGGGAAFQASHPATPKPKVLCGPENSIPSPTIPVAFALSVADGFPTLVSDAANVIKNKTGFILKKVASFVSSPFSSKIRPSGISHTYGGDSPSAPTWLAIGIEITNRVDILEFSSAFLDQSPAEGLLSVFWNTNLIGSIDERTVDLGFNRYRFALPKPETSGVYTLSFRLDSYSKESIVTLTNLALLSSGLQTALSISTERSGAEGRVQLNIFGPPGYSYLVQSSINLSDWIADGFVSTTNGVAHYSVDQPSERQRYYRVLAPN